MAKVHFYKLELNTMKEIKEFVEIATMLDTELMLTDNNDYTVSAKSLMGAIYALEWNELYLMSEKDVYDSFESFITSSSIKDI